MLTQYKMTNLDDIHVMFGLALVILMVGTTTHNFPIQMVGCVLIITTYLRWKKYGASKTQRTKEVKL